MMKRLKHAVKRDAKRKRELGITPTQPF